MMANVRRRAISSVIFIGFNGERDSVGGANANLPDCEQVRCGDARIKADWIRRGASSWRILALLADKTSNCRRRAVRTG
jgi:hypothetical protein